MGTRYFAGVGSRSTPEHVQAKMTLLAELFERRKFKLRTGYAIGADRAFVKGVHHKSNVEIYNTDSCIINGVVTPYSKNDLKFAESMVKKYHPLHQSLKGSPRELIARNTFQYFGLENAVANSEFVLCYTSDGTESITSKETGGTGQIIRIAYDYGTPVFNLKNYIGASAQEMFEFIMKEIG